MCTTTKNKSKRKILIINMNSVQYIKEIKEFQFLTVHFSSSSALHSTQKSPSRFRKVWPVRQKAAVNVLYVFTNVWTFVWVLQSEQIHLLCVRILSTYPPFSPLVSVVIRDGRGGADAPALGAVPVMTLMTTVTTAE